MAASLTGVPCKLKFYGNSKYNKPARDPFRSSITIRNLMMKEVYNRVSYTSTYHFDG